MQHRFFIPIIAIWCAFLALAFLMPATNTQAASNIEYAGWVPYWIDEDAVEHAEDHLKYLDTVHPFVFEVNSDGSLRNRVDFDDGEWEDLVRRAKRKDVEVIPTIAWFDGASIHAVLSDEDSREDHIDEIIDMVDEYNFDGVDIDYESKWAETIDYFSLFLEELEDELGRDTLTCTIEARTPPASRWRYVPSVIEYANDYKEIGRHCDRVEVMAYDQQRIDWRLNTERRGEPYIPVADLEWVENVLDVVLDDIDEDKVMLGIPTYGREWELTVAPEWFKEYDSITALNLPDAEEIADGYDIKPGRNAAGEMSFSYFPEDSIYTLLNSLPTPEGTRRGFEAVAKALFFANATGHTVPVNIVWYSDAKAVEDKIDLAAEYDLRGVTLFKIDGEEDEDIWEIID